MIATKSARIKKAGGKLRLTREELRQIFKEDEDEQEKAKRELQEAKKETEQARRELIEARTRKILKEAEKKEERQSASSEKLFFLSIFLALAGILLQVILILFLI